MQKKSYAKLNATLIHNLKKKIEELKESEEKFKSLFENANDAIFIADLKTGRIIDANKQASKLLKRPLKEIIGMHQTKLHPPDKLKYHTDKFKQGGTVDFEGEVITKDKKIVPIYITANLGMINGKPIVQGIFRNISQVKKAEQKFRQYREKYEKEIRELKKRIEKIKNARNKKTFEQK